MKKIIFISFYFISSLVYSQINYQRTWATYYGSDTVFDGAALDSQNNVYMASEIYTHIPFSYSFVTPNAFLNEVAYEDVHIMITKFDPNGLVIWSTFFYGGFIGEISVDKDDNLYIAGQTTNFLNNTTTPNCFQSILVITNNNPENGYLAKFNPNGQLLWSTYYPSPIISFTSDSVGNVYISGTTDRVEGMATPNAFQDNFVDSTIPGIPQRNGFLAKFDTNGNRVWSTYYGLGFPSALAVDQFGQLYVAGQAFENESGFYATTDCFQTQTGNSFLSKFTPDGERQWSTYYDGNINDLQVNRSEIYLSGITNALGLATENAHQTELGGGFDSFLTKFNTSGEQLWATYYGGLRDEGMNSIYNGRMISFNGDDVYLTSDTRSQNNIATPNSFKDSFSGGDEFSLDFTDNFIVKFNPQGERLWATYYGGAREELNSCVMALNNGSFYTCGSTTSNGLSTSGATQENLIFFSSIYFNAYLARFDIDLLNNTTFNKTSFTLFPNPSNGNFSIKGQLKDKLDNGTVIIYDALGREIIKKALTINQNSVNQEFNLNSELNSGIYFLKIVDDKETIQTFKIIIN